jgi:streptogramin lyase
MLSFLFLAVVTTFAGTGTAGYSGDGGPAIQAQLNNPFGLVRGPDGALYFCDTGNHAIRKITPDGVIRTIAGTGEAGYSGDGGPALAAQLNEPYEVRFDTAGNLFFVERLNHVVRQVAARSGIISTFAGTGVEGFSGDGGPALRATFRQPHSIQFDARGDLYICDIGNHRLRKIDRRTGVISTFAGTGKKGPNPEQAPIPGTPLSGPRAIDFDKQGNLWLALREGNAVYKLDLQTGVMRRVAATYVFHGAKGLSVAPDGGVWLTDTEDHSVVRIDPQTGSVEKIAAGMHRPHGIFVDRDGSVYIGDSESHCIRVLKPATP